MFYVQLQPCIMHLNFYANMVENKFFKTTKKSDFKSAAILLLCNRLITSLIWNIKWHKYCKILLKPQQLLCPGWPVGEPYDGREGTRLDIRDGGRSRQTNQGDQRSHRTACQASRAVWSPWHSPAQGKGQLYGLKFRVRTIFLITRAKCCIWFLQKINS